MLRKHQERIAIVLVRARNPQNIGAVARAMHDLGFTDLRIVNEYSVPFAAAKSAVDASSVLEAARECADVAAAVADCTLVLGTTAVGSRKLEHPLHTLAQAVPEIGNALASAPSNRVALLFGSEKTGLSNEEMSHCHALLTIPMTAVADGRHLSMNLGQAVAICLYAVSQYDVPVLAAAVEPSASAADLERLAALLEQVLTRSDYAARHPANLRPGNLRRLVLRMANQASDVQVWSGILRQLLHALKRE